ncbi:unnamed protein product [Oikopleura dioica]|uniref:Alpha-taxilin n=1 Tax=Oikopleura dioica TaxID=34765 RepID=E4X1A7_OIKDI|nr:unnamed protein product [Oikopleura dioica]
MSEVETSANTSQNTSLDTSVTSLNTSTCSSNESSSPTVSSTTKKIKFGKDVETLMEALSILNSPEERIAALCKKYSDLVDEHNQSKSALQASNSKQKKLQRDNIVLVQASSDFLKKREKDAATINALQNLSRELQDQNRKIKAEVVKKTQEDDNQRRALIEKFQGSLESISKQLDENAGTNEMLRNRNNDLSNSLEQVIEKSEEREKALIKTIEALKEQEKLLREKITSLMSAREIEHEKVKEYLSEKTDTMDKINAERLSLQEQVKYYAARFEEFTDSLSKSNAAITGFSSEMTKMKKVNERLEKAVLDWKSKHSSAQNQLILATEKTLTQEQDIKKKNSAIDKLEKLCRALNQRKLKETAPAREAFQAEEAVKTAESSSSQVTATTEDQKPTAFQPQESPPQEKISSA